MSTLTIRNVVVSVCAGSRSPACSNPNPAYAQTSASPDASMTIRAVDPTQAGLGGDDDIRDLAVADRRVLDERVEEHARPAASTRSPHATLR